MRAAGFAPRGMAPAGWSGLPPPSHHSTQLQSAEGRSTAPVGTAGNGDADERS